MLGKPSFFDCLMLSPPTRKMHKSPTTMIVFLTLFFGCLLIQVFFTFPHLNYVAIGLNLLFTTVCLVCLFVTSCSQPGHIKKQTTEFMRLLTLLDSTMLCADC